LGAKSLSIIPRYMTRPRYRGHGEINGTANLFVFLDAQMPMGLDVSFVFAKLIDFWHFRCGTRTNDDVSALS
jgi:hypothetical protein